MKKTLRKISFFFLEIVQIVAIALVIVLPIRYFVFQPFIVKGASMEPNFHNGDYLVVDELSYRLREPRRGEVVVFRFPQDESQRFIKRIIGRPGETVKLENGRIFITDQLGQTYLLDESTYLTDQLGLSQAMFVLSKDEYLVLGDNRAHSFDSRRWGTLNREEIIGRALIRAWPPSSFDLIETPIY